MPHSDKAKVLLILPRSLLDAADAAAEIMQISRLGFIRQSIIKNIASFHRNDKQCFDLSKNDIGGSQDRS